jgi:tetratricopeptide (TPR) repeat protein
VRNPEARKFYSRAVAADLSYATAYGSSGFHHCWSGRYRAARRGHRRALSLDPENAAAYLGLAQVSAHNLQWQEAERFFRKELQFDLRLVDAYRGLEGIVCPSALYRCRRLSSEGIHPLCKWMQAAGCADCHGTHGTADRAM